jgi:quercetin dioxygenase-like cupin family protein
MGMETRDLRDHVQFSADGPVHRPLFESGRMWSELVCLDRAQRLGPISDQDSDAILTVVAGEVVVHVDREHKRIGQWSSALVPAAGELAVTNASMDPAVVLIVAAPPPTPRTASG